MLKKKVVSFRFFLVNIILLSLVLVYACKRIEVTPSTKELLTKNSWKGDSVHISFQSVVPLNVPPIRQTLDNFSLQFFDNGTFESIYVGQKYQGNWELQQDKLLVLKGLPVNDLISTFTQTIQSQGLNVPPITFPESYEIETLSDSLLIFKGKTQTQVQVQGIPFPVPVTIEIRIRLRMP